jgi:hypothetical protein
MPCFQDCPRRTLHSYIKQTFQLLPNITLDLSQHNDCTIHNTTHCHQLFNIVYYKTHQIHTSNLWTNAKKRVENLSAFIDSCTSHHICAHFQDGAMCLLVRICKSSCNMGWAITCVARNGFFGLPIYSAHSKVPCIGWVYSPTQPYCSSSFDGTRKVDTWSHVRRLVWLLPLAQVLPSPQLIFPSKTWFFGIYLNFQWQKSLKNQYLPHSESKSDQINSIKSCSSRSFQQHQRNIPIPPKCSATI